MPPRHRREPHVPPVPPDPMAEARAMVTQCIRVVPDPESTLAEWAAQRKDVFRMMAIYIHAEETAARMPEHHPHRAELDRFLLRWPEIVMLAAMTLTHAEASALRHGR